MTPVAICSLISLSPLPLSLDPWKDHCLSQNIRLPGQEGSQEGRTIAPLSLTQRQRYPGHRKPAVQPPFTGIASLEEPNKDRKLEELCLIEKNTSLNFVFVVSGKKKKLWLLIGRAVWNIGHLSAPFPCCVSVLLVQSLFCLLNHLMVFQFCCDSLTWTAVAYCGSTKWSVVSLHWLLVSADFIICL